MRQEKVLISIVVAVYNMERYLSRCLDSLVRQSSQNVEFILIDDGSKDRSLSICREYEARDSRFRVIHKDNGGVSSVRNMGVEFAKGRYIWFVDSDDWIAVDSIAYLEQLIAKCSPDAVQIKHQIVSKKTAVPAANVAFDEVSLCLLERNEVIAAVFREQLGHYACEYIFRTELYDEKKIRFPEGRIYEDTATIPKLLLASRTIAQTTAKLYMYFQHTGSATHVLSEKNLINLCTATNEMLQEYRAYADNDSETAELYQFFALNSYVQLYVFQQRFLNQKFSPEIESQHKQITEQIEKCSIKLKQWRKFRRYSMAKNYLLYNLRLLKLCLRIQHRIRMR